VFATLPVCYRCIPFVVPGHVVSAVTRMQQQLHDDYFMEVTVALLIKNNNLCSLSDLGGVMPLRVNGLHAGSPDGFFGGGQVLFNTSRFFSIAAHCYGVVISRLQCG
jgi:hypothetical protein